MKSGLARDFTVRVTRQEDEEERQYSAFYSGIFSVDLNYLLSIMFIPEFKHDDANWSLTIPNNVDQVRSMQEARLFTAALSEIIVTPDSSRAAREERFPQPPPLRSIPETLPRQGIIFYVTPEQFRSFSYELAEIEAQTFSVWGSFPVSQLSHFECIQFITNHIITSAHLADEQRKLIGWPPKRTTYFPSQAKKITFTKTAQLVPI